MTYQNSVFLFQAKRNSMLDFAKAIAASGEEEQARTPIAQPDVYLETFHTHDGSVSLPHLTLAVS